ncbi:hypothetical protein J2X54_002633 [Duganella sp. 3397]|uniref:hypothetical protein n=1 Tax=Duganella sp. 3397 TaxID=2817732 RepID=UPI0028585489|nr:hypothetical protein [Duganella sp. 3397]MDR7050152.1 hypothetical protein [Duganella sp. 3397]
MNTKSVFFATILGCLLTPKALAVVDCAEKVGNIISHTNGVIFFTTEKTCPSWCQVGGNAATVKNSYAMLLAAQASGKKMVFNWQDISTCDEKNKTYAIPGYMVIGPE